MLDQCESEMMSIKFFWICEESMISVENLEIEKWYEGRDTVPATWSSHHLIPMSSSRVGDKLTNEDESYIDIQDFNAPTLFEVGDVRLSTYFTCIYNSFWWVYMASLVDIAAGDVINIDFLHHHVSRKTFN